MKRRTKAAARGNVGSEREGWAIKTIEKIGRLIKLLTLWFPVKRHIVFSEDGPNARLVMMVYLFHLKIASQW